MKFLATEISCYMVHVLSKNNEAHNSESKISKIYGDSYFDTLNFKKLAIYFEEFSVSHSYCRSGSFYSDNLSDKGLILAKKLYAYVMSGG